MSTENNNKPVLFPLKRLFYSRKFMVMLMNVVGSTVLYFVGKYAGGSVAEDIKFLIFAYQPVVLWLINAIAQEDVARMPYQQD